MRRKLSLPQFLGLALVLAAAGLLLFSRFFVRSAAREAQETYETLNSLVPQRFPGIPGLRANPEMPVLELDGRDYVGLLEIPSQGVELPICSSWDTGELKRCPCRFWGSVHSSSLVIGGACQEGQFDFCEDLEIGDFITVTDMTGSEFTYRITHIGRSRHAGTQWLCDEQYDLTLFARTRRTLEYIAVRGTLSPG